MGTPALTTRGMKEEEMRTVAELIDRVINNVDNEEELEKIKHEVQEFTSNYPLHIPVEY